MFCPKCGNNLKDGAKFCPKCGLKINSSGDAKKTVDNPQKPERPEDNEGSQHRSHIMPIVIVAGMVIVAAVALAGVLIYNRISEPLETVSYSAQKDKEETETVPQEGSFAADETITVEGFLNREEDTPTSAAFETAIPTQAPAITVAPDSVTSRLLEEMPDLSDYQRVGVTKAGSTSTIIQKGNQNGPEMVLDGNEVTSWQEGVDGPGIGQIIYFELDQEQPISCLSFKLGNWRNDKYFYSNNRPRTLTITLNDYTCQVTFPAEKKEYFVEINPPYPTNYIEFRIDEVYQGSQYDDTCIAEIGMYYRAGD